MKRSPSGPPDQDPGKGTAAQSGNRAAETKAAVSNSQPKEYNPKDGGASLRTIVLDRQRIRDGFRKGQPTAAFLLILDDRIVWRGFSRAAALEASKQWTDQGATFLDLTQEATHG